MSTPRDSNYLLSSTTLVLGGRDTSNTGPRFGSVNLLSTDSGIPYTTPGQILSVELHGSGGGTASGQGNTWEATLTGGLEYSTYKTFRWSEVRTYNVNVTAVRPYDNQGTRPDTSRRESLWLGWMDGPDTNQLRLYTERALDQMMKRVDKTLTNLSPTKRYLSGGSMGAWGTLTYGIRRPTKFAALYPDRPKWRYNNSGTNISLISWTSLVTSYPVSSSPMIVADDGGGTAADHLNIIKYVQDTNNDIPWIGWCVGRQDGYTPFSDHVAAVQALRNAKRGFAFAWNNGNHSTGSIMSQITNSYPMGLFEIGKGYPLFENCSTDNDPAVDQAGGINLGLTFRNVVETASGFSCEVTNIVNTCSVDVSPISKVYTGDKTPRTVNISVVNQWYPVSFP